MWLRCPLLDKRTADDITPDGCSSCLFLPVPACSLFSLYSSNTPVPLDTAVTRSVLNNLREFVLTTVILTPAREVGRVVIAVFAPFPENCRILPGMPGKFREAHLDLQL